MTTQQGKLIVDGRMLRDPRVSITADVDQVTLCVDDARNAEFWLHLTLSTDRLISWLEMIAAQHPSMSAELLSSLMVLRQKME